MVITMSSASTNMIPFETWGGIAIIIFVVSISIKFIRRRVSLKNLAFSLVLFISALIFLYYNSSDLNIITDFSAAADMIKNLPSYITFIPFGYLLTDKLGNLKADYYSVILIQYITTFLFALIFGIFMPIRYVIKKFSKLTLIGAVIFIALEALIFIQSIISGMGVFFDTGNLILIAIGITCGFVMQKYIFERKTIKND